MRTQRTQLPKTRENAGDQVMIASDWSIGWREFSGPITKRSKAKPMQSQITFDTQLKIALFGEENLPRQPKLLFFVTLQEKERTLDWE